MKLLISSDWHLGISLGDYDRRDDLNDSIEQIKAIIKKKKPDRFIHCGDVFHNNRNLTETMKVFVDFCDFLGVQKVKGYFLVGNHDIVEQIDKTHAVDIPNMSEIYILDHIDTCNDSGINFLFIPHVSRSKSEISPEEQLKNLAEKVDKGDTKYYVFSHCNVDFVQLPNQLVLKYNHHVLPEKLVKSKNVIHCWNGHFHRPEDVVGGNKNFTIVGTPQRFTMDEKDDEKRVILYDTETHKSENIPLKCVEFSEITLNFVDEKEKAEKQYKKILSSPEELSNRIVKILIKIHEKDLSQIDVLKLESTLSKHVRYLYKPHTSIIREKRYRIKELKSNDTPEEAIKKFCKQYNKVNLVTQAKEFMV